MNVPALLLTLANLLLATPLEAALVGSFGSEISSIDPETGQRSFLASTGLNQRINYVFAVDAENQIGYEFGNVNSVPSLSTINLRLGTTHVVPFPHFLSFGIYHGQLLSSSGSQISIVNPMTGEKSFLVATGLSSGINYIFEVDGENDRAFVFGNSVRGVPSLSTVDLLTLSTHVVPFPDFVGFGIYNGRLLSSTGSEIYDVDPMTGQTTHLAPTGLDRAYNFQFVVDSDNHVAHAFGQKGTVRSLSTTNLLTGDTRTVPLVDEVYPTLEILTFTKPENLAISSIEMTADGIRLEMPAVLGHHIGVEYSTDATADSWIELGNFFGMGTAVFFDPDPQRRRRPRGFYRAFLRPRVPF